MHFNNIFARSLLTLFVLALFLNAAVLGAANRDDKSDAWVSVETMLKFLGPDTPDRPSAQQAGNEAIGSLEKAISREENDNKKDKLIDAKTQVRKALDYVSSGDWREAKAAATRARDLIQEVK